MNTRSHCRRHGARANRDQPLRRWRFVTTAACENKLGRLTTRISEVHELLVGEVYEALGGEVIQIQHALPVLSSHQDDRHGLDRACEHEIQRFKDFI